MGLPSALFWIGLTLILLPIAVICAALIVAICISTPSVGLIVVIVVAALIAGRVDKRRKS